MAGGENVIHGFGPNGELSRGAELAFENYVPPSVFPDWGTVVTAAYQEWLDDGNTGTIEEYVATLAGSAYGAVIDTGSTPPASSTSGGKPVIWIPDGSALTPVPVTPTQPSFDLTAFTVTPPSLVGVEYQLLDSTGSTWTPIANGTATSLAGFTRPFVVKVRAVAKPGYILTGTYQWERQLIDASSLVLFASDSYSGPAGTQLADNTNTTRRSMDMALGGSASGGSIPSYYSLGGGFKYKTSDPTRVDKFTGTGADVNHVENLFLVGATNYSLEVTLSAWKLEHSSGFTVYLGDPANNSLSNAVGILLYQNSTAGEVRFPTLGSVTGQNIVYRTGLTEAMMLGTWKFSWVNKFAQVTAPDGQVFGKDYSAATQPIGQYAGFGVSNFGTKVAWAEVDAIKVYR